MRFTQTLTRFPDTSFDARQFVFFWFLAGVTFGAGDLITTMIVYHTTPAITEANGLIAWSLRSYGTMGLVSLKITGLLICLGISLYALQIQDRFLYYFPPTVLTVTGTFLTTYNSRLLLG